jgi:hypothetical protein
MTEDRVERIVQAVRGGSSRAAAAGFAGVNRATLQEWLARGHSGEQPYADFLDKVEQAEGALVTQLSVEIVQDEHWQAKAWMLKRKDASYRDPPVQVEMTNPDGSLQPVGVALQMTPDAVRLIREFRTLELQAGAARQSSTVRPVGE